jgi:hypothetical protein
MKPVKHKFCNATFGEDQPNLLPLPAWIGPEPQQWVVTCWRLTLWERLKLLVTGRLWLSQLTYGWPLHPNNPNVTCPLKDAVEPAK